MPGTVGDPPNSESAGAWNRGIKTAALALICVGNIMMQQWKTQQGPESISLWNTGQFLFLDLCGVNRKSES